MSRLRFVSGRDFLDHEASFDWVIPPFVAKGSSMMIYGRQGLGKSSIIMQLVDALGTGAPWLGFPVHSTGKTLYLSLDMAEAETKKMLERCGEAGLRTAEFILLPRPPEGEEALEFDIFNEECASSLKELCSQEKPVCVVVDAIQDAFSTPIGPHDVNALAREVLKAFRACIGDAVLVFLNHQRKAGAQRGGAESADDDNDSFMGGTAWEAKATASLRLWHGKDNRKRLKVKKCRLDKSPVDCLVLEDAGLGFYKAQLNVEQVLMLWPLCITDATDRANAVASCKTQKAVFQYMSKLTGASEDTIKKMCQRARAKGVDFPWIAKLESGE